MSREESHDIDESVPDVPAPAPPAAKTSPGEPGDAKTVPPCQRTDSRTATSRTVTGDNPEHSSHAGGGPVCTHRRTVVKV